MWFTFSPDRRGCEHCPTAKDIVNATGQCQTCDEGSFPNGERNSCSECKPDERVDFDGSCKKCQEGFVPTENRRYCIRCPKSLIANEGMCKACGNPKKEWVIEIRLDHEHFIRQQGRKCFLQRQVGCNVTN